MIARRAAAGARRPRGRDRPDAAPPPARRAADRAAGVPAAVVDGPVHERARATATGRVYLVARVGGTVVGYGGLMLVLEDGHITTLAVDPAWHRHRSAPACCSRSPTPASSAASSNLTLEVRLGNEPAQELYRRFGFAPAGDPQGLLRRDERGRAGDVGQRRRHARHGGRLDALAAGVARHDRPRGARPMTADAVPTREPHPRHRDVVRRDRGGHRARAARRCCRRWSAARSTCTPATAASCPRSPAVPTSTCSCPSWPRPSWRPGLSDRAPTTAPAAGSTRSPPPTAPASSARCSSACRRRRRWRSRGTCRSSP